MKKAGLFLLVALVVVSCKKKSDDQTAAEGVQDSTTNISESAVAEANSQANAIITARANYFERKDSVAFLAPQSVCDISSARSSCSSMTTTLDWAGCSIGTTGITLSGTITETFSGFGAAVCQLNGDGSSVSRVISASDPRTLTFASGAKIVSDMEPPTAWDGTTFSSASTGTVITASESGIVGGFTCAANNPCYSLVVNGLHNVMTGPKGTEWFNHIITSNLTAQGRKSTNDLIVSGAVTIWHQLLDYKAVNTFNNVTWGDSACCFPTSGSMTTALTGSLTASLTTTFSSTCGSAQFTNEDGDTSTITLTNCGL